MPSSAAPRGLPRESAEFVVVGQRHRAEAGGDGELDDALGALGPVRERRVGVEVDHAARVTAALPASR